MSKPKNWFDQDGQAYARFRPEYPPALAEYLASLAPDRLLVAGQYAARACISPTCRSN